mgnify:CR=1 FL=1
MGNPNRTAIAPRCAGMRRDAPCCAVLRRVAPGWPRIVIATVNTRPVACIGVFPANRSFAFAHRNELSDTI